MSNTKYFFLVIVTTFLINLLSSCDDYTPKDNQTSGTIKVSIDETYKPVMEEQLKIFMSRYPNAHIIAEYKPEASCIKDFLEDTTRVIFVTRELSAEEKKYCDSKQIYVKSLPIARDAIAFITSTDFVNPNFKYNELCDILSGSAANRDLQVVFDNNASSTVRFVLDSMLHGKALAKNTFATKTSEEVINYISTNDKAIGVIGVSWVADHSDSTTETFLQKVKVAGVWPNGDSAMDYVRPYQAYIGLKSYPCTRNLYFISKESWTGLGTGLVNYLCRDGQLVFKQAKMFPLQVNVLLRETNAH
ncbi:MAG TPA: substrate-binding domain-containing protein [Chitinophagaceae bacterium]|nr:substrate-binding domain-containing protein [Chitinophagaceae bacterium]